MKKKHPVNQSYGCCVVHSVYLPFWPGAYSTSCSKFSYILPVLNRLAIFMAIWPVCMFRPMRHGMAGGKRDQLAEFYEFKNCVSHCAQNCISKCAQNCISHQI